MIVPPAKLHSADVQLNLFIQGCRFELGHLGPDFAILSDTHDISATEGEIETVIDGKSTRISIRIISPITEASRKFTFEPRQ